jgi:hypothetical protein
VWTSLFAISYFLIMKAFGLLRVELADEIFGFDQLEMGGISPCQYNYIKQEINRKLYNLKEIEEQKLKQ